MDELTPIDEAHAIMIADEDDEAARLGFFARLAASEVFLLLERPADGDQIEPQLAGHDGQTYALVFDREERLTAFTGEISPFAALSGRTLAEMLYGQEIGIGLNLDVAPSSILLPAEALDWLAEMLADAAEEEAEARVRAVSTPTDVPEAALTALDRRLATMAGRAERAYLVAAVYTDGREGLLLAIAGALPEAEGAIAAAVKEVAQFSSVPLAIDVAFFAPTDFALVRISEVGLRFDLPEPEPAPLVVAPGMDPDAPPKLR